VWGTYALFIHFVPLLGITFASNADLDRQGQKPRQRPIPEADTSRKMMQAKIKCEETDSIKCEETDSTNISTRRVQASSCS
jgi:hypothetical protein